jgi:hypothetical protein
MLRLRLAPLTALACAGSLFAAAGAHAGALVRTVGPCDARPTAQVFLPWLDPLNYAPVAGGGFEDGAAGWSLTGAADDVAGNQSSQVARSGDARSLSIPSGSSATSPATCVGLDRPVLRLFARNAGSALSSLRVEVLFEDAGGTVRALPIALLPGSRSWSPTLPVPVVANLLPLLPGAATAVAFRFTPLGLGGSWAIDDVEIDPRRSR